MTVEDKQPQEAENQGESVRGLSGALNLMLPVDPVVWSEARKLVGDKKVRVEDLAACFLQDPVLIIELLKTANAIYFADGKPPITSIVTSIIRLGSQVVQELLESLKEREQYQNEDVSHWVNIHRSRGKRTSIVARIFAEAIAKPLSDDCQAAGLLSAIGEMLAVGFFQDKYVNLAEDLSRSGLIYRLSQDYKFDTEKMGLLYLRRQGIPEMLLFALDREAQTRSPDRAIMKPLVMSASELVEAFDGNKWERLAPGKPLSSKSNIRLLQISDSQYLKVYERAGEYLYAIRLSEEKQKAENLRRQAMHSPTHQHTPTIEEIKNQTPEFSLQDEITALLGGLLTPVEEETAVISTPFSFPDLDQEILSPRDQQEEELRTLESPNDEPIRVKMIAGIEETLRNATSSDELLKTLLGKLLEGGLFKKSALIVIAKDKKSAKVIAARGANIEKGQTVIIDDPLSPLAECFSKVQSFSKQKSKHSPFGSKSFAVAPIEAGHETPVALYADCGNGSVTFEGRRVFRNVVDLLNQKLPTLPGGLPFD